MNNTGPYYRTKRGFRFYIDISLLSMLVIFAAIIGNMLWHNNYSLVKAVSINTVLSGLVIFAINLITNKIFIKSNFKDTIKLSLNKTIIINVLIINSVLLNINISLLLIAVASASLIVNLVNHFWVKDGLHVSVISLLMASILTDNLMVINNFYLVALCSMILLFMVIMQAVKKPLFYMYFLVFMLLGIIFYLVPVNLINIFNTRFMIILIFLLLNNQLTPVTPKAGLLAVLAIGLTMFISFWFVIPMNYFLVLIMLVLTVIGLSKNQMDLL